VVVGQLSGDNIQRATKGGAANKEDTTLDDARRPPFKTTSAPDAESIKRLPMPATAATKNFTEDLGFLSLAPGADDCRGASVAHHSILQYQQVGCGDGGGDKRAHMPVCERQHT
jgi:hypothetical protein